MSEHQKQQAYRGIRLVFFTLMSSALFANTVNAWAARYPLIGAGVAALEMLYRYASPVVPGQFEPTVTSMPVGPGTAGYTPLTPATGPFLNLPEAPPGVVDSTLRTHPGTGAPMQGITVQPNADGTFPPVTISNPPPPMPGTPGAPPGGGGGTTP